MVPPTSNEKRELLRVEFNKRFLIGDDYELVTAKDAAQKIGVCSKTVSKFYAEFAQEYYRAYLTLQQQ